MRKRSLIVLPMLLIWATGLQSQGISFHGQLRNSIYAFESDKAHTRIYQFLQFNALSPCKKIGLNANIRVLSDVNQNLDDDLRFRAFSLNLDVNDLFNNRLDLRLGRQFFHPGTPLGGLDGLNAHLTLSRNWSLQVYGGAESTPSSNFEMHNLEDNMVLGGMVQAKKLASSNWQLFFLQKSDDAAAYWQLAGANVSSHLIPWVTVRLQSHYDLKNERLHRMLFNVNRAWNKDLKTYLEYKQQHPQVYANSYFTIFEVKPYQQLRAGADWQIFTRLGLEAQYQHLMFDGEGADRMLLSLHNDDGAIGMLYETGYSGDQISAFFNYGYAILPELVASLYVDYAKYRTETIYEYDDQLANAVRLSYNLGRKLNLIAEYQWLSNDTKKQDSRFLNHITFRW